MIELSVLIRTRFDSKIAEREWEVDGVNEDKRVVSGASTPFMTTDTRAGDCVPVSVVASVKDERDVPSCFASVMAMGIPPSDCMERGAARVGIAFADA